MHAVVAVILAVCPTAGEGPRDCPWAGIARDAVAGDATATLEYQAPSIWRQLATDALHPELHALWGESRNRDEIADKEIVDPRVLTALARRVGLAISGDRVPAGLIHTYGYLFSLLPTPFGFKRARWVAGELETGLGLPAGSLGPTPTGGTLYANATWILGRLALEDPRARHLLGRISVPEPLRHFRPSSLRRTRLEERVRVLGRTIILRTDVVAFLRPGHYTHLAVYSVADAGGNRLLTAFPVGQAFVSSLVKRARSRELVRARFNAWVDGLPKGGLPGRRTLRR